ncbi:ImmA/IrrE family metallo-endopeptidase [Deinococcus apachensis]|uniref:ImmA/IrrE family metallo-endopeptidase n=1 Tax=Deinococcus apachensis TaxID=309886 RepID=UPI0003707643|nr:ImmA/IrrE family metallo-endopeptidase [Deinococcus apachensis]
MSDPVSQLFDDLHFMLERMGWPTPMELARALDIKVTDGPVPSINLDPPPTIQLPVSLRGFRRRHTLAHEIAHALMNWREIDAELLMYYAPECAHSNLEALANHIAGLIAIPPPIFQKAMQRYGFSPTTMTYLARVTGAPLEIAMDRVIYESDSYRRAAMLFKRNMLIDFASTIWLEADLFDVIPDPRERFPGIVLQTMDEGVLLGTWGES